MISLVSAITIKSTNVLMWLFNEVPDNNWLNFIITLISISTLALLITNSAINFRNRSKARQAEDARVLYEAYIAGEIEWEEGRAERNRLDKEQRIKNALAYETGYIKLSIEECKEPEDKYKQKYSDRNVPIKMLLNGFVRSKYISGIHVFYFLTDNGVIAYYVHPYYIIIIIRKSEACSMLNNIVVDGEVIGYKLIKYSNRGYHESLVEFKIVDGQLSEYWNNNLEEARTPKRIEELRLIAVHEHTTQRYKDAQEYLKANKDKEYEDLYELYSHSTYEFYIEYLGQDALDNLFDSVERYKERDRLKQQKLNNIEQKKRERKREEQRIADEKASELKRIADKKAREIQHIADEKQARLNEVQRVKASTAGKLINKAVDKVNGNNRAGVYLIVNNKTLDFYIGESQNMLFRMKTHFGEMLLGTHHRPLIQEHFDKYGKDVFDFYILKYTNTDQARKEIEDFYIDQYLPTYN